MKRLLLPAMVLLMASCDRTPHTVVIEDNPKYCWECKQYMKSTSNDGSYNMETEKDTTICDKRGLEITAIMDSVKTSTVTIGNFVLTNKSGIRDCRIK